MGGNLALDLFSVLAKNQHIITLINLILLNKRIVYFHNFVLYFLRFALSVPGATWI